MYQSINFGVIGVQETDLEKKMQLAKRHGFTHMEAGADEVTACGVEKVKALLQQYGMEITCFNVPFHPGSPSRAGQGHEPGGLQPQHHLDYPRQRHPAL